MRAATAASRKRMEGHPGDHTLRRICDSTRASRNFSPLAESNLGQRQLSSSFDLMRRSLRVLNAQEIRMLQKSPRYAYIPVKDLARARQFYEQKIGLKPKQELPGGILYEFGQHTACFMYSIPNAGT